MIKWLKSLFCDYENKSMAEIDQLRAELAQIRHIAEDELKGMIVEIKFDTMVSIADLRQRVSNLEKNGQLAKRSRTTQQFIYSYLMGEGDDKPSPSDILRH